MRLPCRTKFLAFQIAQQIVEAKVSYEQLKVEHQQILHMSVNEAFEERISRVLGRKRVQIISYAYEQKMEAYTIDSSIRLQQGQIIGPRANYSFFNKLAS